MATDPGETTILAATALANRKRRRTPDAVSRSPRAAAFLLTVVLLGLVQGLAPRPLLLAERFLPGAGWAEVVGLSAYSAWLMGKIYDPEATAGWRRRLWLLFSVVFFLQLLGGLAGAEKLLMTGALHLPVPALIVAGPIYRGGGWFMPALFVTTLLWVGPAWCSYLCYVGSWDLLSSASRRPLALPTWRRWAQLALLLLVVVTALGLRHLGVPPTTAAMAGAGFGLGGVVVMLGVSRRTGVMVHCTLYCPIGLLANLLGKLSPLRMRIARGCHDCGACSLVCRYDALRPADIRARRPGITCTLCGDCVASCHGRFIQYRLGGCSPRAARATFLVLAISLHATFLGVARL
jgi:polyferredoxin